jgi:3-oxoacyl-[acyl-carrier-protein] synthase II
MEQPKKKPKDTRVVITGIGTINPIGHSVDEFWHNLAAGKSGIRAVKNLDVGEFAVRIAGEIDLPDVSEYIPKKMVRRLGRFITLGQVAAVQAFRDANLDTKLMEREANRIGAIIGVADGGNDLDYKTAIGIHEHSMDFVSPFYIVGAIPNTPAAYFAKTFGLMGPNFSVNSACASSNHAIGTAALMIKMGYADIIFTGGAEGLLTLPAFSGFNIIAATSRRNDEPTAASRPFDKDRDGFVLGEGAGILCLEELQHAKKRGAFIYAEIAGMGFSCDAFDLVAPHPEGKGAKAAMKNALEDAMIRPEEVDLINAHGTSTILGDLAESKAINQVFGNELSQKIPVHSTKSMIGHTIGAAGGIEVVAAILAIQKGIIHPSLNYYQSDPDIHLNVVAQGAREQQIDHVLSNSFGFGGQNSTLIISRFKG